MKLLHKHIALFFALACSISVFSSNTVLAEAEEAFRAGDFARSIELYETVIAQELAENNRESAQLHYNLGNAYFRNNELGRAILNFERALLLDPGNSDIRHNLRFAPSAAERLQCLLHNYRFLSRCFYAFSCVCVQVEQNTIEKQ